MTVRRQLHRLLLLIASAMLTAACVGEPEVRSVAEQERLATTAPTSSQRQSTSPSAATSSAPASTSMGRTGTPFGTFSSLDNVDDTFDRFSASRFLFGSPEEATEFLEQARATNTRLVFSVVQAKNMKRDDGTFDLSRWKSEVDRFAGLDLEPYVADGTVLAHYMIDEPKSRSTWGGEVVSNSAIEEMAGYSKTLWPTVPTAVRNAPTRLVEHALGHRQPAGEAPRWQRLDVAWVQYNASLHGDIVDYVQQQRRSAEAQGLDLIVGLQALAGGDGSSGRVPDAPFAPDVWIMSYDEMMVYGEYLLSQQIGCAFITFRWQRNEETYFDGNSDQARAHSDLAALARQFDPSDCHSR